MVTVKVHGGLGNQMFQYAMGRALALRNGDYLYIDISPLLDPAPRRHAAKREYGLGTIFQVDPKFILPTKIFSKIPVPYLPAIFGKYYPPLMAKFGYWKFIQQEGFAFDPVMFNLKGNVYLEGGWYTEKYFKDYEDVIRKDFSFRNELQGASAVLQNEIRGCQSVAVHVRRGDRVWSPMAPLYIMGTQEYYDKALLELKGKIGSNVKLFIFSDGIEWCRKNLKFDVPHAFVGDEYAGAQAGGHFQLMSSCKHFILPESTFSWWAAWLSSNKDKAVIVPRIMFNDATIDTKDAYPKDWIRV